MMSTTSSTMVKFCVVYLLTTSSTVNGFTLTPATIKSHRHLAKQIIVSAKAEAAAAENKLSNRAQRKKKERLQKNKQRGGGPVRASKNSSNSQGNVYKLHSTAVSALTRESTTDDVTRAIKRAQKQHDAHDLRNIERFLLEEVDKTYAYGYRGSLLSRLAVAAMHMNESEIARKALEARYKDHHDSIQPLESAAVVRGLLRLGNVTDALIFLDDELALPEEKPVNGALEAYKEKVKYRALSIASFASRECFEDKPNLALTACRMLKEIGPVVREADLTSDDFEIPWLRIVQGAAQFESRRRKGEIDTTQFDEEEIPCNLVYSVLDAMSSFPSENRDDVYECLSNALVRRTQFVTGAVSMAGLPNADRGEAAFIGRSNVGKSSLVNMITNRKSLAYTSKTPGKTQQFNYFAVNDKPELGREIRYGDVVDGEKDKDSFYIVDLPGFGYAEVSAEQRQDWKEFMAEYLSTRKTLRVLFHLVDARHGPTDDDKSIMQQVSETLPRQVSYVVVLTKADKNTKGKSKKNTGKVSDDVMAKLRNAMKEAGVGNRPVLLTSSETKLGRDQVWRYLSLAARR
mmetsp:Transcript_7262/g.10844  ORF Transcript_7262/g.10844 Transcript_7262/m.10844 type:complete len:573 (-) Transcript_7262:266-1984(-)